MAFFFVEVTDTFGGCANYSWVRRYKVKASSVRGAILKVSRNSGYQKRIRKDWDSGSMVRYSVQGACVCAFVSDWDEDSHNQYSRVTEL
jgi:hypothetical protein